MPETPKGVGVRAVVLRSRPGVPGVIRLTAASEGLALANIAVTSR